jgi:tRNA 5-methylaminomethyl-2-thiouridine biosynthesis bifunctional protein
LYSFYIVTLNPAHLQWSDDGKLESTLYGDVYFQHTDGIAESRYVFLEQNRLPARFAAHNGGQFSVAELGFGTGLNFLLTREAWKNAAPQNGNLFFASIEKHPLTKDDLAKAYALWPQFGDDAAAILDQYPPLIAGFHHIFFNGARLMLCFGDVSDMLPELSGQFDAWFLDGFSPAKNPAMWTEDLFPQIAARTKPSGTLSTFSVAGHMRRALKAEGFTVKKIKGFGIKWSMTAATFAPFPLAGEGHATPAQQSNNAPPAPPPHPDPLPRGERGSVAVHSFGCPTGIIAWQKRRRSLPFSPRGRRWPRSGRMRGRRDVSGWRLVIRQQGIVTAPPHPNPLPRGERG